MPQRLSLLLTTVSLGLLPTVTLAQQSQQTSTGLTLTTDSVTVDVQFYSPDIVRVFKQPKGHSKNKQSLVVVLAPAPGKLRYGKQGNLLTVSSATTQARLNPQTGQVSFFTSKGQPLVSELAAGLRFTPKTDLGEPTYQVRQTFRLTPGEAIYGLGQHQDGWLNYRGHKTRLRQQNLDIAVPVLHSSKGYGLFWDNYSSTQFTDDDKGTTFDSEVGDCADYYLLNGQGSADGVVARYRTLTGQAPLFPRWTLGFWQSKERYKSQQELLEVVEKYRSLGVPLDGIVQDWQYWGEDNDYWNSTEFGNPRFPDPKGMVDKVHALHAHQIISVWPSFGNKTKVFQELKQRNMLYDFITWPPTHHVQVYDAFNPAARDLYWSYLNKNIFALGMDGWWLDATEPDQIHPLSSDDENQTALGSFRRVRNAFPLLTTTGVYQHQRQTTTDKRVFILTRSAFAGQQRNATMTWSGDVQSSWDVLAKQLPAALNLSLAGVPYWNSDIGGFFPNGQYPKGVKDPAFQELFTRWQQFAAFTPMMRAHGEATPREIYQFGERGTWAFDSQEKYINLRYRLLPYLYSIMWGVTHAAGTLMRALPMDFPQDPKVADLGSEYLFGPAFLVRPVTESQYVTRADKNVLGTTDFTKTKTTDVYLPAGASWVDFWTGRRQTGGQTVSRETPIDVLPLYVRAGSVLPLAPRQQYTGEKDGAPLEIRVYPGANGEFTLYEDENDTYNYEKGAYATIRMRWDDKARQLTFDSRAGSFPGMQAARTFRVVLVDEQHGTGLGQDDAPAKEVKYAGQKTTIKL
ncbi:glycoside hydrolase family 31 protein [Hymenobacter crusticola]|uniref:Xylosidase n=1 Tax=Hymenobacter crusticola TaxID=1770526 RepID=A0A243WIV6_9BACT|nr:TIM-barrel domain-containing protein [Hymenobacter crusticola]OUJ75806.1 xylosidase [Hymenobacter crusticola]